MIRNASSYSSIISVAAILILPALFIAAYSASIEDTSKGANITVSEIETAGGVKIFVPNSLINSSLPSLTNLSFSVGNYEAYLAIKFYAPSPNGDCGGGGGGPLPDNISLSASSTSGSNSTTTGLIKSNVNTQDNNGFIQTIQTPNGVFCAHGGWR